MTTQLHPTRTMNWSIARAVSPEDEIKSVATLVRAFAADPAVRWVFADRDQYLRFFPDFIRAFAGQAFPGGTAEGLDDFSAAALWLAPGIQPDDEAVGGVLQRCVPEERLPEVFSLMEQMGQFHPQEPHWYLPLIGVDPCAQGKGYGSVLLEHALKRCDRERLPAYLESTSSRNLPLYERFGFEAVGKIQTETSPPIIPMVRRPRVMRTGR